MILGFCVCLSNQYFGLIDIFAKALLFFGIGLFIISTFLAEIDDKLIVDGNIYKQPHSA